MRNTILICLVFFLGCQSDNNKKETIKESESNFKQELIQLLLKYPEERLNDENDVGKFGLNVVADGNHISIAEFKFDKIVGVAVTYNRKSGNISDLDSTNIGGSLRAFHDDGVLAYSITNQENADTIVSSEYYVNFHAKRKGYLRFFDRDGKITEEGTVFYRKSIELDYVEGKDFKKNK